jgi:hypothetical protein
MVRIAVSIATNPPTPDLPMIQQQNQQKKAHGAARVRPFVERRSRAKAQGCNRHAKST